MIEQEARKLAEAHWEWFEPIALLMIPKLNPDEQLYLTKYLYITAMVHGIRHEVETQLEVKDGS